jgi:hypothetical protein
MEQRWESMMLTRDSNNEMQIVILLTVMMLAQVPPLGKANHPCKTDGGICGRNIVEGSVA